MTPLAWILLAMLCAPWVVLVVLSGVGMALAAWQTRGWGRGPRHRPRLRVDLRDHLSVGQAVYVHQDGFVRPCPPPDPTTTVTWDEYRADPEGTLRMAERQPVTVVGDERFSTMTLSACVVDASEADNA